MDKSKYLANLIRLADADGIEHDLEFLAILTLQKRLRAKVQDYLKARQAEQHGGISRLENPLLERRLLKDLFMLALIDGEITEDEEAMIDRFIEEADIPDSISNDLLEQAQQAVDRLLRESMSFESAEFARNADS